MKYMLTLGLGLALLLCVGASGAPQADKKEDEPKVVKANGTIEPEEVIEVGAQVSGFIQKFGVDIGDKTKTIEHCTVVKKGALLVQIDPAPYEAVRDLAKAKLQRAGVSVRLAVARIAQAEKELQRTRKREADKVGDASDVEVAKSALEVAKEAAQFEEASVIAAKPTLAIAELTPHYAPIHSPIDGVILDRRAILGQYVSPSLSTPSLFLIAK